MHRKKKHDPYFRICVAFCWVLLYRKLVNYENSPSSCVPLGESPVVSRQVSDFSSPWVMFKYKVRDKIRVTLPKWPFHISTWSNCGWLDPWSSNTDGWFVWRPEKDHLLVNSSPSAIKHWCVTDSLAPTNRTSSMFSAWWGCHVFTDSSSYAKRSEIMLSSFNGTSLAHLCSSYLLCICPVWSPLWKAPSRNHRMVHEFWRHWWCRGQNWTGGCCRDQPPISSGGWFLYVSILGGSSQLVSDLWPQL